MHTNSEEVAPSQATRDAIYRGHIARAGRLVNVVAGVCSFRRPNDEARIETAFLRDLLGQLPPKEAAELPVILGSDGYDGRRLDDRIAVTVEISSQTADTPGYRHLEIEPECIDADITGWDGRDEDEPIWFTSDAQVVVDGANSGTERISLVAKSHDRREIDGRIVVTLAVEEQR